MDIYNDGMFRAQDGTWISFSYQMFGGRVVMVSYFTEESVEPCITWFDRKAA